MKRSSKARSSPSVLRQGVPWHQAQALVDRLHAAELELRLALIDVGGLLLPAAGRLADAVRATQRLRLEVEVERDRMERVAPAAPGAAFAQLQALVIGGDD